MVAQPAIQLRPNRADSFALFVMAALVQPSDSERAKIWRAGNCDGIVLRRPGLAYPFCGRGKSGLALVKLDARARSRDHLDLICISARRPSVVTPFCVSIFVFPDCGPLAVA